ncbi:MAG TPA: PDZ domain-containing protein [Chitinophagaceae bacterium]|jgi:serine protease Do|nr:PDZ domain-containing protein [Chitinophagaceae bacterium]
MKQYAMKKWAIAGAFLLTVPTALLAQDAKDKEKEKEKAKKEMEQIIITRTGDPDEKTVVEIKGDNVIVNGKVVESNRGRAVVQEGVTVRRHKIKDVNAVISATGPRGGWTFNMDDDAISLFTEDENRAMLGVVTESDDKGARIVSVNDESAAEKAGLKEGDVLTRIDDQEIDDTDDVTKAIRKHKPGEKANITFLRNGKEQKVTAELGKWKGVRFNTFTPPRAMSPVTPEFHGEFPGVNVWGGGAPKLGLSVQDSEDGKGVEVLEVDEESNAAKAGLKEGDVITGVDDTEIAGVDQLTRAVRSSREKATMNFKVLRGGKTQTIEVRVPRRLKTADL